MILRAMACGARRAAKPVHTPPSIKSREPAKRLTSEQRRLASQHLGLVGVHLRERVSRIRRNSSDRDDLYQAGCLGLVLAASRYDPRRDGAFAAFALLRIRRAVHAAALGERAVIRVPYGVACRQRTETHAVAKTVSFGSVVTCREPVAVQNDSAAQENRDTIRHAIRARFQRSTERALRSLAERRWRRKDSLAILTRIAAERVLIGDPHRRTPIRRLAFDLGIASGQVTVYEQHIMGAIREEFGADVQVKWLLRFARQDAAGFDGLMDEERRQRLMAADVTAFEQRFTALDRAQQAELLYELVERSTPRLSEVARNLYQLSYRD